MLPSRILGPPSASEAHAARAQSMRSICIFGELAFSVDRHPQTSCYPPYPKSGLPVCLCFRPQRLAIPYPPKIMGCLFSTAPVDKLGSCKCGKVQVKITEAPVVTMKCHCKNCRAFRGVVGESDAQIGSWLPMVGFYRPRGARVLGEEHVGYERTVGGPPFCLVVDRGYCKACRP